MTTTSEALLEREEPGPRPTDAVGEVRDGIDAIDRALVELLADRCRLARELGRAKRDAGVSLVDHPREARVVRRGGELARRNGLDEELVRGLFWGVVELARRTQRSAG